MPSYELTYFNARGVAEPSRMLLVHCEVEFEDLRVEMEQWPAMKGSIKQGKLPMLKVDDKIIVQSGAINRYLARELGMFGKNNNENTAIDEVLGSIEDLWPLWRQGIIRDETNKLHIIDFTGELMKKVEEEVIPPFLKYMNTLLKENGGEFFVGDKLSLADIAFYTATDQFIIIKFPNCIQPFPDLVKHREKIAGLPKIKEYLAKRPKTEL